MKTDKSNLIAKMLKTCTNAFVLSVYAMLGVFY